MTLTVTSVRKDTEEEGSSDQNQQRNYSVTFRLKQTDTGSRAGAPSMITAAQALGTNPVPIYGDVYHFDGDTDLDSYAQTFSWSRPKPADNDRLLDVKVGFAPVGGGGSGSGGATHGRLVESDPLLWETTYHVDWTEEQVVLSQATNVEPLPTIDRPALTSGKLVNACGVEFAEPLMKANFYPILQCTKPYATQEAILALNMTYQNTTNNGTFFGSAQRTAKYLGTECGTQQKINGHTFYMGITRIWFKKQTWDRPVLNNGWSAFGLDGSDVIVDGFGIPVLFKNKVHDVPQDVIDDSSADPDIAASEPLNLDLEGLLLDTNADAVYVTYRDLAEVDYSGIGIGS